MLNKPVDEIVMEGGHVVGVKSEGEVIIETSVVFIYYNNKIIIIELQSNNVWILKPHL